MAFNNSSRVKTTMVKPKHLLFTQPDIKSTFTDPDYPSVTETISLIRRGRLDPDVLGPLHVYIDKHGRMWCDNNRRLFALRKAGVRYTFVVFDGVRRPTNSFLKTMLSDPDFMPRIRGEMSRVRMSPPPTSGWNARERQKEAKIEHHAGYAVVESFEALTIRSPPPPASGRNASERQREPRIEHRAGYAVVEPSETSRVRILQRNAYERRKESRIEHRIGYESSDDSDDYASSDDDSD